LLLDSLPHESRGDKWFVEHGGIMVSPELRGGGEEDLAGNSSAAFVERLGLFRKTGIDLPETVDRSSDQSGQTTPIRLLSAFAPLINGGTGVIPHLGEAVIGLYSGRRSLLDYPEKPELVKPETSEKIIARLANSSGAASEAIFLESLRPVESGPGDGAGDMQSELGRQARYQTVMIGFAPLQGPEIVLLITLDQAIVDVHKKTVMRGMGEAMLGQLVSLAGEKIAPVGLEVMAAREKLLYESWRKSQAQVDKKKDIKVAGVLEERGVMPELKGLSLRKALRNLQELGLKVEIVGSGRVVTQEPKCGATVSGNMCRLTLRADS
jgi:cell division protein FtsI (penicillin-binding protein 3)